MKNIGQKGINLNVFQMKKQFRKRWRRWRRAIWTCTLILIIGGVVWAGQTLPDQMKKLLTQMTDDSPIALETLNYLQNGGDGESEEQRVFMQQLNDSQEKRIVHLRTLYVCGVEEQILGSLDADSVYTLLNNNPAWKGRMDDNGEVWLEETVSDDLSPTCKEQAYMSVDANGNLTLFDGPPQEEKVLRTFFQLDIDSMESSLPKDVLKQLQDGIRIQDIDEYNSVLSTFSDYARDMAENVMKAH
ncbi:forespore regulator of the sigma-K checkpoint [Paenibacillus uliginis N3/975]|uniref:Forespore regulator of the sigma-K checkpoint n=2 Tax=Paenibacillus TaxID=44249 RepID=A0A1X7HM49_9BACL|nr:forespore regulator of the sigma-K checkpoint [Paenibacillus uliginis N3/975]